jgi:hypothetical protein
MSSIAADAAFPERNVGALRRALGGLKRSAKAIGHWFRRGLAYAGLAAKQTAIIAGHTLRWSGVSLLTGVRWTIGAVLSTISWTMRGILTFLTSSLTVATMLVGAVALIFIMGVATVHGYWKDYIHPAATWLLSGGSLKAHYRSSAQRRAEWKQAWSSMWSGLAANVFGVFDRDSHPYNWQSPSLDERVSLQTMDDANNSPFPGTNPLIRFEMRDDADVLDYEASDWPFTKEGQADTEHDNIVDALTAYVESGKEIDDFNFAPWIAKDAPQVVQAMKWITDNGSFTAQERAYWIGRHDGLVWLLQDPSNVEQHGRGWSLLHNQYQGKAADIPLAYLRTGYMRSVNDMTVALETAK